MAFESLSDRFSSIFKKLRGQAHLTEKNMDEMLKEIRVALLEADVNFKVVKAFTNDVKEKSVGLDGAYGTCGQRDAGDASTHNSTFAHARHALGHVIVGN